MRIFIFTNTYKPAINGVVTSIANFRIGLERAGHHAAILAPQYSHLENPKEPDVYRIPAIDFTESLNAAIPIPIKTIVDPIMQGYLPDLIHSQHPLLVGNMAVEYACELNIPLVFTFHTRYDEYAAHYLPLKTDFHVRVTEQVVKNYLEKCSHIIAPTESIRTMIVGYGLEVPVTVIPTPVDLDRYRSLDPEKIRKVFNLEGFELLLYVGRISVEKNLDFLMEAFEKIQAQRPQTKLMLCGQGSKMDDLVEKAKAAGLSEAVIFTGPVPNEEIPHFTAAADVFVFPSTTETQGLVLAEAMAAGTPVVAVKAPGQIDVLNNGGGLLVDENQEQFVQAVIRVLVENGLKSTLGEEAKLAAKEYGMSVRTAQLVEVYQKALSGNKDS